MIKYYFVALSILILAPTFAIATCDVRQSLDGYSTLFDTVPKLHNPTNAPTFVFFVNGDADHFVQPSLSVVSSDVFPADNVDVRRIQTSAERCHDCNVVLLHVKLPENCSFHDQELGTTFQVWSRGKRVLARTVPIINAADPEVLSRLLRFSGQLFPGTELHLVYRGHSFYPNYDPKANPQIVTPFANTFSESPYGIAYFAESLRRAGLAKPLKSLVLAACSMAFYEAANAFAPYAETVYASQVDINESLAVGFDYGFLASATSTDLPNEIGRQLLSPFFQSSSSQNSRTGGRPDVTAEERTDTLADVMMETPLTKINLQQWNRFSADFVNLLASLKKASSNALNRTLSSAYNAIHIARVPSDRYLRAQCGESLPSACVQATAHAARLAAPDPEAIDLGLLLDELSQQRAFSDQSAAIQTLRHDLNDHILQIINAASQSEKSGLSIRVSELLRMSR